VDTVLIAESHGFTADMKHAGQVLPNGAVRAELPFSERAVELHPERFAYLCRIDMNDPEIDRMVREVRTRAGRLCLRVVPIVDTGEVDRFAQGAAEPLFAAAEKYGVPIFASLPGRGHMLVPYLEQFPDLQVILDHTGVGVEPPRIGTVAPTLAKSVVPTLAGRVAQLDQVLEMARFPNLALKWCHAPARLSAEPYPHRDTVGYLKQAIAAFGPQRVLWASDYTQSRATFGESWAEQLYYVRDSDLLTEDEKAWLLGKTVRKILRWTRDGI
jgi:predicted TIM-barrel fold metal-dependent hydrolase